MNLREEIEKILIDHYNDKLGADQAVDLVLKTLLERLPKENGNVCEFDIRLDIGEMEKASRRGYNQALKEVKSLLGGEK